MKQEHYILQAVPSCILLVYLGYYSKIQEYEHHT